jgi:prophage regulatory protein
MTYPAQDERFLPIAAVVEVTSLSRAYIWDAVAKGRFPKPVRISVNRVAWPASTVAAWIAEKIAKAA